MIVNNILDSPTYSQVEKINIAFELASDSQFDNLKQIQQFEQQLIEPADLIVYDKSERPVGIAKEVINVVKGLNASYSTNTNLDYTKLAKYLKPTSPDFSIQPAEK